VVASWIRPFTLHFIFLISVFKLCRLLAHSTRSQWWGCYLSLWGGWFSVGVTSPSVWNSPFATRQWSSWWSGPGILFSHYPPYLVSIPLSATWAPPEMRPANPHRSPTYNLLNSVVYRCSQHWHRTLTQYFTDPLHSLYTVQFLG
jgi:hypothetical protein